MKETEEEEKIIYFVNKRRMKEGMKLKKYQRNDKKEKMRWT